MRITRRKLVGGEARKGGKAGGPRVLIQSNSYSPCPSAWKC